MEILMKKLWNAVLVAGALALSPLVAAEEAATTTPAATTTATPAEAETAAQTAGSMVEVSATGDQVVKVTTGNEAVDAVGNYAMKCAEKTAAMKTCDTMGGFKAMGCRKLAEMRYKNTECPIQ
jgi:hypothetical protein